MYSFPALAGLENQYVRLSTLSTEHSTDLWNAVREDDGDLFEHLFFGPFENVDDVLKWTQRASSNPHNVTYAIRSRRLRTGNRDSAEHGSSSAASPFRSTALSASRMEMRRNERR
mgnify:FL=1